MIDFEILKRKVAIIGAGFVGSSIAYALTIRRLAREIVLIDIDEKKSEGEALDIQHGIPDMGISSVRAGSYKDCKDCDLIIITAGRNRRPGNSGSRSRIQRHGRLLSHRSGKLFRKHRLRHRDSGSRRTSDIYQDL